MEQYVLIIFQLIYSILSSNIKKYNQKQQQQKMTNNNSIPLYSITLYFCSTQCAVKHESVSDDDDDLIHT